MPENLPAAHPPLHMLSMLRTGGAQAQAEQRLLHAVCAHWQRLGHATLVLDASQRETAARPGLLQRLQGPGRHKHPGCTGPHHALSVLPAQQGLKHLGAGFAAGALLPHHLRGYSIALLYAGVATLAPLLPPAATPLLLLPAPQGRCIAWQHMHACYRHIQHLAQHRIARCLLAAPLMPEAATDGQRSPAPQAGGMPENLHHPAQIQALRQCARRHLGHNCTVLPLCPQRSADLRHLALRWLAHAHPLPASTTPHRV